MAWHFRKSLFIQEITQYTWRKIQQIDKKIPVPYNLTRHKTICNENTNKIATLHFLENKYRSLELSIDNISIIK
jgi:hypothetical protein